MILFGSRRKLQPFVYTTNYSILKRIIERVKGKEGNMNVLEIDCGELKNINLEHMSSNDSGTTGRRFLFELGILSVAFMNNVVIDTVRIDSEIIQRMGNGAFVLKFFSAIGNIPNLQYLHICTSERRRISVSLLTAILQSSTSLRSFALDNAQLFGTRQEFEDFSDALLVLSCTTMTKFKCIQVQFPDFFNLDHFMIQSLAKIPLKASLESIQVAHNGSDDGAYLSAEAIHSLCQISGLKFLSLNGLGLDSESIAGICYGVEKGELALEVLNLSWNNLNDHGGQLIVDSLRKSSRAALKELYLSNNKLRQNAGLALAQMLQSSDLCLQCLDISNNRIGDPGVVAVAKSLLINDQLRKLRMNNCDFGDDGIKAIAASLCVNKNLRELQIKFVGGEKNQVVSDASYKMFIPAMEANLVIQKIIMDLNQVPKEVSTKVINYCSMNISGKRKLKGAKNNIIKGEKWKDMKVANNTGQQKLQNFNPTYRSVTYAARSG